MTKQLSHEAYIKLRDEIVTKYRDDLRLSSADYVQEEIPVDRMELEFETAFEETAKAIDDLVLAVIGQAPFNYMSGGIEDAGRIATDISQESLRIKQRLIVNGGNETDNE